MIRLQYQKKEKFQLASQLLLAAIKKFTNREHYLLCQTHKETKRTCALPIKRKEESRNGFNRHILWNQLYF
jgi:hypothetical protein